MKIKYHIIMIFVILLFLSVGFLYIYLIYEHRVVNAVAVIYAVISAIFFALTTLAIQDYISMIKRRKRSN